MAGLFPSLGLDLKALGGCPMRHGSLDLEDPPSSGLPSPQCARTVWSWTQPPCSLIITDIIATVLLALVSTALLDMEIKILQGQVEGTEYVHVVAVRVYLLRNGGWHWVVPHLGVTTAIS